MTCEKVFGTVKKLYQHKWYYFTGNNKVLRPKQSPDRLFVFPISPQISQSLRASSLLALPQGANLKGTCTVGQTQRLWGILPRAPQGKDYSESHFTERKVRLTKKQLITDDTTSRMELGYRTSGQLQHSSSLRAQEESSWGTASGPLLQTPETPKKITHGNRERQIPDTLK